MENYCRESSERIKSDLAIRMVMGGTKRSINILSLVPGCSVATLGSPLPFQLAGLIKHLRGLTSMQEASLVSGDQSGSISPPISISRAHQT